MATELTLKGLTITETVHGLSAAGTPFKADEAIQAGTALCIVSPGGASAKGTYKVQLLDSASAIAAEITSEHLIQNVPSMLLAVDIRPNATSSSISINDNILRHNCAPAEFSTGIIRIQVAGKLGFVSANAQVNDGTAGTQFVLDANTFTGNGFYQIDMPFTVVTV